jgi:hypothetical protein
MSPHTLLTYPTMFTPQRLARYTADTECLSIQTSSTCKVLDGLLQLSVVHRFWTSARVERDSPEEVVGAEEEGDGKCEVPEGVSWCVCGRRLEDIVRYQ